MFLGNGPNRGSVVKPWREFLGPRRERRKIHGSDFWPIRYPLDDVLGVRVQCQGAYGGGQSPVTQKAVMD